MTTLTIQPYMGVPIFIRRAFPDCRYIAAKWDARKNLCVWAANEQAILTKYFDPSAILAKAIGRDLEDISEALLKSRA